MPLTARIDLRVSPAEKAAWDAAAEAAALTTSEFIRQQINQQINVTVSPPAEPEAAPPPPAPVKQRFPLCYRCAAIGVATCDVCKFLAGNQG